MARAARERGVNANRSSHGASYINRGCWKISSSCFIALQTPVIASLVVLVSASPSPTGSFRIHSGTIRARNAERGLQVEMLLPHLAFNSPDPSTPA